MRLIYSILITTGLALSYTALTASGDYTLCADNPSQTQPGSWNKTMFSGKSMTSPEGVSSKPLKEWISAIKTEGDSSNKTKTKDCPGTASGLVKQFPEPDKWKLAWSDEFNYSGLPDSTKWNYDVGGSGFGNNELQYYTLKDTLNALVKNGVLTITARKQAKEGKSYTSARLLTKDKSEFTYGKFEIRARLPRGIGTWPAIWMLGKNIDEAGWPACGEIDIMEHVGYEKDSIYGTIHSKSYNHMIGTQKVKAIFIDKPYDDFHVFSIEWTPEKIDFLVDSKLYNHIENEHKSVNEWPFDQPFFLILNLAIGGNWGGKFGVDDSIFPAVFEVDYVRVYNK